METRPPPDLIDGNEEYEVEVILTHQTYKNRQTRYLVKWKGYDSSENTWEPESNLSNAEEELSDYKTRHNL
jgi:chromodomain protein Y